MPDTSAVSAERRRQTLTLAAFQLLAYTIPTYGSNYGKDYRGRLSVAIEAGQSLFSSLSAFDKAVADVSSIGLKVSVYLGQKFRKPFGPAERVFKEEKDL